MDQYSHYGISSRGNKRLNAYLWSIIVKIMVKIFDQKQWSKSSHFGEVNGHLDSRTIESNQEDYNEIHSETHK